MNFAFHSDLAQGTTAIVNRHPLNREKFRIPHPPTILTNTVYGLVAHQPNLTHTGHLLILDEETMAATQTASDFFAMTHT